MFSTLRCLAKPLVLAEVVGGRVTPGTLAAVTAASKVGTVSLLLAGSKANSKPLTAIAGVQEVLVGDAPQYEHGLAEEVAELLTSVLKEGAYSHIFAPSGAFAKGVLPRAAAAADAMPISDVIAVHGEDTFTRLTYAGNVVAKVKSLDAVRFVTVRGTAFEKAAEGGSAPVRDVPCPPPVNLSKWVEDCIAATDKPDLTTAAVVVSGGRGLKSGENFKLLDDLAKPLNAAVGATRAVVDAGFCPNEMQVGQTGKVVAPSLYLAVGLSGAIQHIAGMKDSKVIACINTDADAPIFQVSDYGLCADLFEAVPQLTQKLSK